MARARRMEAWNHTASLLVLLHNINAKKGHAKRFEDFHPLLSGRSGRTPLTKDTLWMLKALVPAGKRRRP